MILSNKILVKSSKYYNKLGYDISEKYIEIKISDLPHGSHVKIEAKCDYCINTRKISYKEYNKNISINNKFSCSIKCGCLKSKETNLEKYGVESTNQLDSKKEKSRKTTKEKWGVDHISKIESIIESKRKKMIEKKDDISKRFKEYWNNISEVDIVKINDKRSITNLERYGFEYVSQVKEFKDKIRETNLQRWGGYTYQSCVLMNKVISTNLERWGVTNSSCSETIKEKIKETNLEKYGGHPSKTDSVKDKQKTTVKIKWGVDNIMFLSQTKEILKKKMIEKWGVDSYFKTLKFKESKLYDLSSNESYRKDNFIIAKNINYIRYLGNNLSEFTCDSNLDHNFVINSDVFFSRISNNNNLCSVCYPINTKSIKEKKLLEFVSEIYSGEIIENYRDVLEIDIYLPDLKIGFEFNGLWWHSSKFKDKNYHYIKSKHFENNGIRIFNIWEDDWNNKNDIVKSQIQNSINTSNHKIWARKCSISIISDTKLIRKFLNENHIQGYTISSIKLGLFYEDELVSIMTFDMMEGRKRMKDGEFNLNRFCSKINTSVIGGASRLLNFFIMTQKPHRIISYADMDWSKGNVYSKLGFTLIDRIDPDYKYLVSGKRVNKQQFTKSKLRKKSIDTTGSETSITKEMGIYKIYNCGKLKFQLLPN